MNGLVVCQAPYPNRPIRASRDEYIFAHLQLAYKGRVAL